MSDPKDIVKLTAMLSAAYPNWNVTEYTNEIYFQDLQDIPADELFIAAQHCRTSTARDQRFAPSAGEIRMAVLELRRAALNVPSAYDAWQEVITGMVERIGYDAPEWSSPLITKVVKSLGWRNLCMSENQTTDRARFVQAYEQLADRAEKEMMLPDKVRNYLEDKGAKLLDTSSQIKQLTKGFEK